MPARETGVVRRLYGTQPDAFVVDPDHRGDFVWRAQDPELMRGLGTGIKEFKQGMREEPNTTPPPPPPVSPTPPPYEEKK